ncbi:MAG: hypothetical protein QM500_12130 [Methylococcales bacterium]
MSQQFYLNACKRTINKLNERSISIPDAALATHTDLNPEFHRDPLQLTDFHTALLDHYDSPVYDWYRTLIDNQPEPDWQVIHINPDTSPLEVDEWYLAAPDKMTALGYLLDIMQRQRIVPISLSVDSTNKITLTGETGILANIYSTPFETTSKEAVERCKSAIKGISPFNQDEAFAAKLNRIEGLSQLDWDNKHSDNKSCMHVSCKNVSLSMRSMLEQILNKPVKLSLAQEVAAAFFGFKDWNTFQGRELNRQALLNRPFMSVYNKNETYKIKGFYPGLPSALHHFGKLLLKQESQNFVIRPFIKFYAFSDMISLYEMEVIEIENDYKYVASTILASSSAEEHLLEYFHTGKTNAEKIVKFNERIGIKKEDHLFLNDWVFWLDRNYGQHGLLVGNKLTNFGKRNEDTAASEMHKASIVYDKKDNTYWLATDWNRKPKHYLSGINKSDIEILENKFHIETRASEF